MFHKKKICADCGSLQYIFSKKRCLKHAKRFFKKSEPKQKEKKKVKLKTTGEKSVFLEIWEERLRECTNCLSFLGNEPKASYFAHKKPKSTHPELRLDKTNIVLLCFDCHYAMDHRGKDAFNKRKVVNNQ